MKLPQALHCLRSPRPAPPCWRPHQPAAQSYPDRPIRMIVPAAAGGSARHHRGASLRSRWASCSGSRSSSRTSRARPASSAPIRSRRRRLTATRCCTASTRSSTMNPALYAHLPYQPQKDLVPVGHDAQAGLHADRVARPFPAHNLWRS